MSVNVNPIMAAIVEAAETLNTAPDDYINPDDGLKYCGKCHTPKEAYFPEQYRKNGLDKHPVACKCAVEERARREAKTGWTSIRLPVNARLRNGRGAKQNSGSWNG